MMFEFWFDDVIDYYKEEHFIDLGQFLLLYVHLSKTPQRIPSLHFWAFCIIFTKVGLKIMQGDGTIWTIEGLFEEIEELWWGETRK